MRISRAACALLVILSAPSVWALDPRFQLDTKTLEKGAEEKAPAASKTRPRSSADGLAHHQVKPGDHIFKILMKDYGMSNPEAEALIPEIRKINRIANIRHLQVGSTLLIPTEKSRRSDSQMAKKADGHFTAKRSDSAAKSESTGSAPRVTMLKMAPPGENNPVGTVRQVWDRLLPGMAGGEEPIELKTSTFSLSLDPARYPVLPAADGGRIVIDSDRSIPSLVKTLIQEKDDRTRIISENPHNRKQLYASLLQAAGFYSVEPDFSIDFGTDPKLTVNADFKVEKTPDSVMSRDVVLMNVGEKGALPDSLVEYLRRAGFNVIEPQGAPRLPVDSGNRFVSVRENSSRGIADSFLKALAVPYAVDKSIEFNGWEEKGIRLDVKVDRYFEDRGEKYAITWFDGNPVTYTLTRLLETKGYRVIVLGDGDDFRKVSETILTRMREGGRYGSHPLWASRSVPYSVQMSGVMLKDRTGKGNVFITDLDPSPVISDLLSYNGYKISH